MKHLENCPQAVLLAVTLGPGVDAQIRRAGVGDIAAGVRPMHWQRAGRAGRRRSRSRAAPVGRKRGKVFDRAVFARLR